MRDYFEKLAVKVKKYTKKYAEHPRKAALKLAYWNFICCFRKLHPAIHIEQNNAPSSSSEKIHHTIAIRIRGGIGDQIIGCNYAWNVAKKFPELKIDIYTRKEIHNRFISEKIWNGKIFDEHINIIQDNYDALIQLDRYPHIIFINDHAASQLGKFMDYISILKDFKNRFNSFFDYGTRFDGVSATYSSIIAKKRIQQPDINNFLSIKEEFSYNPPIKYTDICKKYNLTPGKFITIHRGCDTNHTSNSMKLWPLHYYNILIKNIKYSFPDITIVQMGVNSERCPDMEKVDCNLVGKTTLDDVCTLLKYSRLHIDSEGGFVHMRHALKGGRSVVLFGPTAKDFFGYSENINLRSDICPHSCEHIIQKWDTICIKNNTQEPLCMHSLHPEDVLSAVLMELNNV